MKLAWLLAALQLPLFAQPRVMSWTVDGVRREAIVYSPASKPTARAPLVFAFHGHGDTADNYQGVAIHEEWPQAVIVYPQGLDSPHDGAPGWQVERGKEDDRDLKLVDRMLATLREQFSVDSSRIYSTGFSNGANFTYLLWAERPHIFAAYAPVAARILPSVHLTVPKPVLHVGGTADRQIAFSDQKEAIAAAMHANGVPANGVECGRFCTTYESNAHAPVMTVLHPGGHTYPRGTSRIIVDFFKKHSLSAPHP